MFFLFSGEGPTDLGTCSYPESINTGENYLYGPLTVVVDQIVEERDSYSLLEASVFGFVPETMLCEHAKILRPRPKSIRLPGKTSSIETRFYHRNARAFAQIASRYGQEIQDSVVAILFRDGDKPNNRGDWESKRKSIIDGFTEENFLFGVPMMPKSVSESWILCAIYRRQEPNPVDKYHYLEDTTFGIGSDHQLKGKLAEELGDTPTRELLNEKIQNSEIDFQYINLPSFNSFKERLLEVLR